ncbi:sugar phosphate isomerase/epimerase family protein [Flagellimonas onchidii]|uniref:sugar phosphate isomerase/epimerase family protein n=1 Tax=Flagellimonas onchidii TaxID=2562684 RepID=UPI0010A6A64D|nr:sugar phosphate isomerase/epimerase [Allomuricauda onchidii]
MEFKFIYPRWGSADIPWPEFLQKVKEHGYDGVEIDLPLGNQKKDILSILKDYELNFVGQHWETKEVNFEKHKEQYKGHLYNLAEANPLLINSHTGMDFFSFGQNAELIEMAMKIEEEMGVTITHETHRSRFSFAAHVCHAFLKEYPKLKLTSDFSHWCCVAETLLENQSDAVNLAIERSYHIHARVGSAQSPQVIDPRSDTYALELKHFMNWWKQMLLDAQAHGREYITITPEYGPEPYALLHPNTKSLLADQWEVNQFIKGEIMKAWT